MTNPTPTPQSIPPMRVTLADVKANESVGWFVDLDGVTVRQVMTIHPYVTRLVGELDVAKLGEAEPVKAQTAPKGELASEGWNKQLEEILTSLPQYFEDILTSEEIIVLWPELKKAGEAITALKDAEVERALKNGRV